MKRLIVLGVMLLAVILVLGCAGQKDEGPLVGGDRDEHGCIPSAGYKWCPSTEKCQRMWEEYCEEYADEYRGEEQVE